MGHLRLITLPKTALALLATLTLSACVLNPSAAPSVDSSGASKRGTYAVTVKNVDAIRNRGVTEINRIRSAQGLGPVVLDPMLTRAADAHSADISRQNRAWDFGSDGSTPISRIQRAGYHGRLIGELVSQTYETEIKAINHWMQQPEQREILLDPRATAVGFGVMQEDNNKIWWTLTIAQ